MMETKARMRAAVFGICVNLCLFMVKLYVGISTNSISIYVDSLNNALDSVVCIIALVGFWLSVRTSPKYPFGLGRAEDLTGFITAVVIVGTGFGFGYVSLERTLYPAPVWFSVRYAVIIAVTAVVKLLLGAYYKFKDRRHPSPVLKGLITESVLDFFITLSTLISFTLTRVAGVPVDGVGNQVINIVNSDGVITRALITLDSHSYIDGDVLGIRWLYDNIHENQINWYKNVVLDLAKRNQDAAKALPAAKQKSYAELEKVVPTSVFFHFPMEEYRLAWTEYVENDYKDTKNVKYRYGLPGESGKVVYCGIHPDQLFETMQELGSTDSTFCGHDHYNNFSLNYKGINLTYGYSIDYLAYVGIYKQGTQRGCTILDYDQNGGLDFHQENYYQDKYQNNARESVTMQEITTSGLPVLDAR